VTACPIYTTKPPRRIACSAALAPGLPFAGRTGGPSLGTTSNCPKLRVKALLLGPETAASTASVLEPLGDPGPAPERSASRPQHLGASDADPHVRWRGSREVNPPADPIRPRHFRIINLNDQAMAASETSTGHIITQTDCHGGELTLGSDKWTTIAMLGKARPMLAQRKPFHLRGRKHAVMANTAKTQEMPKSRQFMALAYPSNPAKKGCTLLFMVSKCDVA
jgi:hypothetical protein